MKQILRMGSGVASIPAGMALGAVHRLLTGRAVVTLDVKRVSEALDRAALTDRVRGLAADSHVVAVVHLLLPRCFVCFVLLPFCLIGHAQIKKEFAKVVKLTRRVKSSIADGNSSQINLLSCRNNLILLVNLKSARRNVFPGITLTGDKKIIRAKIWK